ncbi:MAG: hypothetical protein JXM69_21830 [Anaerolineae bacterium]|nr:hypothetical protein [Anaerolineae bacterium]
MLNAVYWFQPHPGPLTARSWIFYAFCALVFLGCLVWAGWYLLRACPGICKTKQFAENTADRINRQDYGLLARFELMVGFTGLLLIGARLAMVYGWSARIWPLALVGLAAAGPAVFCWASRPASPLDHSLKLLTFRKVGQPLPIRWQLVLWILHLTGLAGWVHAVGWPLWSAGVLWSALLVIQFLVTLLSTYRTRPRRPGIYTTPLFPLFLAYLSAGFYLLLNLPQQPDLIPLQPGLAELWALPFYVESMSVAAVLYALLVNLYLLSHLRSSAKTETMANTRPDFRPTSRRLTVLALAGSLAAGSLGWMAFELFTHHTHGVTGTDPYGYAQVAVDLVERGSALHRFDLFPHIADLPIAWAPVITLGYHLPLNEFGDAASVWPLGMSFLLAGGYALLGEAGLYVTAPVIALLTALAVAWLTIEISRSRFKRDILGAVTAGSVALFVWTTSIEVIDRSLVPMADVAAAFFTALVWIALLKSGTQKPDRFWKPVRFPYLWALTAGICLGLAFDVRYTQLLLVVSVVLGLGWQAGINRRQRVWLLVIAGTGALLAALPDIIYRWQVFGSPLANPQARELTHFAWSNLIPTTNKMRQQLFHGQEFGLLLPFLIAGISWHWRQHRPGFVALAAGALAVMAIQLPYESLRLRDLLFLFPLLAAWTGTGLVWLWRALLDPTRQMAWPARLVNLLIALALFLSLLLPAIRIAPLVARSWHSHRASFGYVTGPERTALAQLAQLTPNPAVIGADYNGGSVTLHSQRWAFYPGGWTEDEFDYFLIRMANHGLPIFLLNDGPAMQPVIARLAAAGQLRQVARLCVPLPEGYDGGQFYEVLNKVRQACRLFYFPIEPID